MIRLDTTSLIILDQHSTYITKINHTVVTKTTQYFTMQSMALYLQHCHHIFSRQLILLHIGQKKNVMWKWLQWDTARWWYLMLVFCCHSCDSEVVRHLLVAGGRGSSRPLAGLNTLAAAGANVNVVEHSHLFMSTCGSAWLSFVYLILVTVRLPIILWWTWRHWSPPAPCDLLLGLVAQFIHRPPGGVYGSLSTSRWLNVLLHSLHFLLSSIKPPFTAV